MSKFKDIARRIVASLPIALTQNLAYDRETKRVMKKVLGVSSNCIDVGCHKGEVLEDMLSLAPKGKHFGFEPIPHYFENLGKNFPSNCSFYQLALSDTQGQIEFNYVKSNPAFSGIKERDYPKEEEIELLKVKTDLLDHVIGDQTPIHFIKIDVEGAELGVLKGGINLLKKYQPVVVFEHGLGAADHYGTQPEEVFELLTSCGLEVNTMKRWLNGTSAFVQEEFKEQFQKGINYYFIASPKRD